MAIELGQLILEAVAAAGVLGECVFAEVTNGLSHGRRVAEPVGDVFQIITELPKLMPGFRLRYLLLGILAGVFGWRRAGPAIWLLILWLILLRSVC